MRKPTGVETVDGHVGQRLRLRRRQLGVSQAWLADAVQLTSQQIQKYEHGVNRISASTLYAIAQVLEAPVSFFFEGLAPPRGTEEDPEAMRRRSLSRELVGSPDGVDLADAFLSIRRPGVRDRLLGLVRGIADDERDRAPPPRCQA